MIKSTIDFFKTGADKPVLADKEKTNKIFNHKRWSVLLSLIFGYGFFYTCRLSMSVAKKPMLDAGILDVSEMGIIGSVLLYIYAIGKFANGFLSDRANIRRFMSITLLLSAFVNILFGFTTNFYIFIFL